MADPRHLAVKEEELGIWRDPLGGLDRLQWTWRRTSRNSARGKLLRAPSVGHGARAGAAAAPLHSQKLLVRAPGAHEKAVATWLALAMAEASASCSLPQEPPQPPMSHLQAAVVMLAAALAILRLCYTCRTRERVV